MTVLLLEFDASGGEYMGSFGLLEFAISMVVGKGVGRNMADH